MDCAIFDGHGCDEMVTKRPSVHSVSSVSFLAFFSAAVLLSSFSFLPYTPCVPLSGQKVPSFELLKITGRRPTVNCIILPKLVLLRS